MIRLQATRPLCFATVCAGALLCSGFQKQPDEKKRDFVLSTKAAYRAAGHIVLDHFRQVLKTRFCFDAPITITVYDEGTTRVPGDDFPQAAKRNDLIMPWFFENNSRLESDPTVTQEDLIKYFTRPGSSNYSLSHELGHDWLEAHIAKSAEGRAYNSILPDWLDESIAIGFEHEAGHQNRRKFFIRDFFDERRIFSLRSFMNMPHPSHVKDKASIIFIDPVARVALESDFDAEWDTVMFYQQGLVFTDFIADLTGNQCILADLGRDLAASGARSYDEVAVAVGIEGVSNGDDLETLFLDWVTDNLGPANDQKSDQTVSSGEE